MGCCLWLACLQASAADFEAYSRLMDAANAAHAALDAAPDDQKPALREQALADDLAVIEWLDTFFASDEYAALPAEQRALAARDRYRTEFNAARLLIDLDRCPEARDRIRALLDSAIDDPELRPRLAEAHEEAITCANRARVATLHVQASPSDAQILLDGELIGLGVVNRDVTLGSHTVLVRADGYASQELSVEVADEGSDVAVGPIALISLGGAESARGPTALEWTLWGAGAAALGTGIFLWLTADSRQSDIDAVTADPSQELVDASAQQSRVDNRKLAAYLIGGAGLASAVAGTVLFLMQGRGGGSSEPAGSVGSVGLSGVVLTFPY